VRLGRLRGEYGRDEQVISWHIATKLAFGSGIQLRLATKLASVLAGRYCADIASASPPFSTIEERGFYEEKYDGWRLVAYKDGSIATDAEGEARPPRRRPRH
jgi:hypothetical protein